MREIKFRAWDKLNKKIVTSGLSINLDTTDRVMPISFSQGDLSYCRDNGVSSVPNIHTDIEIMQYTGLKDKSGVEIYEGDIVQVFRHDDFTYQHEPRWISDIYWANGGFQFTDLYTPNRTLASLWSPGESLEVIGNIYESPGLLNTKLVERIESDE